MTHDPDRRPPRAAVPSVVRLPVRPAVWRPREVVAFAELGAMSNFSFREGASHPHELAATARALGHVAIGVADRQGFAGQVRTLAACEELGLRQVVAARLTTNDGAEWLAWPADRAAWSRLTRLFSAARAAEKEACDIPREALFEAALGSALARVAPARPDAGFAAELARDAAALRRRLVLPLFCAVAHRAQGAEAKRLEALGAMAEAARAPLLAAGGVRYHAPERRRLADVLSAIRLGCPVDQLGLAAEPNAEAHLKPGAEMLRLFARRPEAVANTLRVVEACRFSLRELAYEYPREILEPGFSAQQTLERRVAEAVRACWPAGVPEKVAAQIAHELGLIERMGYAPYFLTVHEIVRFARAQGILCQGRGSAANSAVCYALGITAVPPDKHDLLFERFISEARDEPPDIDVDFEHERREEVIQHIYARYGRERAAIAATVIRWRERSAIREVGKAMGLTEDVTARLAKSVWNSGEAGFSDLARELGLSTEASPRLALACELAEELVDFPRHLATHVGGFVITDSPLVELAVVTKAAMENRHTLEWDKDDIETLKMLKVDVLGLGMLSVIRRALDLLGLSSLTAIPQDDAATYAMLARGDSLGVFQVESRAQMNMLPRLRPRVFYDLVIEVAIVRPGPIQGDMVHPYLRRRNGEEPVEIPPGLEGVLGKTLGVPLFQEQAMKIAIVAAGFTPTRADALRRAMATFKRNGSLPQFRAEFLEGMAARDYDPGFAERCFRQLEGFGTYGFPESHAASFAQLVYISAWIKRHHPAVFAAALLNSQPMGFYAPAQIVRDAREHGVEVRPPCVVASGWDCSLEDASDSDLRAGRSGHRMRESPSASDLRAGRSGHRMGEKAALRLGLRLVSGLKREAADALHAARPFADARDLLRRARIDRGAVLALAEADTLRGLGLARREALWLAAGAERPLRDAALPLFAAAEAAAALPRETAGEETVADYAATGLSLRAHPLALIRPRLDALGAADTRALAAARQGQRLRLAGLVLVRQRPGSAKGVVFFTVEDEWGVANLVLYPDMVTRHRQAVVAARLVLAEGRVERTEAEVPILHLIVQRLTDRSDLLDGLHALEAPAVARGIARADEVKRPNLRGDPRGAKGAALCHPPEPGVERPPAEPGLARMGRSRDFH